MQYLMFKNGYCSSNLIDGGGFWWSDRSEPDPNIQFFFVPHSNAVPYRNGCSMNFYDLRPRSRGTVRLKSADPGEHPLIDPNFFADEGDMARTVGGLRLCREIMAAPAMARLVKREFGPGPDVLTDEQCAAYARSAVGTGYHMVGTCKMGTGDDAVVSTDLRVRGLTDLRVIDSSVMPQIVSGNTNLPSMMIGEKGADLVRGVKL
jgi:choline dehydrogenase-like flavoprotein